MIANLAIVAIIAILAEGERTEGKRECRDAEGSGEGDFGGGEGAVGEGGAADVEAGGGVGYGTA